MGYQPEDSVSWRPVLAGCTYFALIFALGFMLGTLRVLVLEPNLGRAVSTLIELPFMLLASWFVCGWLIRRFQVRSHLADRFFMGAVAFGLLMIAEVFVSTQLMARSWTEHLAHYATTAGQMGLFGQALFAGLPVLQLFTPPSQK